MVLQVLIGTLALGTHPYPADAMTPNVPYTTILSTQFSTIAAARQEVVRNQAQAVRVERRSGVTVFTKTLGLRGCE